MSQVFKKLTPRSDLENISPQVEALNFAMKEEDVFNIALTGNYGSGKSSFIETFKKRHCDTENEKKFLHISLSRFSPISKNNEQYDTETNIQKQLIDDNFNVLEGKIVNQLLHQIDSEKIPLTIFKTKQNYKRKTLLFWFTTLSYLLISLLVLWNYSYISFLVKNIFPKIPSWGSWIQTLIIILLAVDILFVVFQLTKLQLNKKLFRSIKLNSGTISGEIEILGNSDISYFDQYLDDVIYLFDNCESDIIVFEDIDRFETNLIFSKLKEINSLVNGKRKLRGESRKLIFLYLIKDDMFVSKDRTKFFDFIIPIIPAITSSNSREKFDEILVELGCQNDFHDHFLKKISIYVDDLRLASNICNEYVLYKNTLIAPEKGETEKIVDKLKLSAEKLFAIVVYKNVFPKDFSDLQKGTGFIYRLFYEKNRIKENRIAEIDKKISEAKQEILDIENEAIHNELELYSSVLKPTNNNVVIQVNDKFEYQFDNRLDYIAELLKDDAKIVSYEDFDDAYRKQRKREVSLDTIFNIPDSEKEKFNVRLEYLKNKSYLESLNKKLSNYTDEKKRVQYQRLSNLITRNDIDNIAEKEFEYMKTSPQFSMISFLIRNAYIDESYPDYITYFYPGSLKKETKEFIMAVQGEEDLPWDYPLDNFEEIHNQLETSDFNRQEILNYDLFAYTMTHSSVPEREQRLEAYFVEHRLDFIVSFFNHVSASTAGQINTVLEVLNYNPDLLELFWVSDDYLVKDKFAIFHRISFFVDLQKENLPEASIKLISEIISNYWQALWEENLSLGSNLVVNEIKKNLKYLDVKIVDFRFKKEYSSINESVYENNLYDLNSSNINTLLKYLDTNLESDQIKHKNFSIINSDKKFSYVLNYIKENFEDYIGVIIEYSDGKIKDDTTHIYEILNDVEISEERKSEYLACLDDNILKLSNIDNRELKDEAVVLNKAAFNTENVLEYFFEYETWNDSLINFVNSKPIFNIDMKIFEEKSKDLQEIFFEETVKTNDLLNRHYKSILSAINWWYNSVPKDEIDVEKIDILIETGAISEQFENSILIDLRKRYHESVLKYILKFLDGYIENIDSHYNETELLEVLEINIPFDKAKILVDRYNETISIKHKNYNQELTSYIIETRFKESDLPHLLENYDSFSSIVQSAIFYISKKYIDVIIENDYSVKDNLLQLLIKDTSINLQSRRLLYSRKINKFDIQEFLNNLNPLELSEDYQRIIKECEEHKNPKIIANDYNENFLNLLQVEEYFKSFDIDPKDNNYYRIYSFKKK